MVLRNMTLTGCVLWLVWNLSLAVWSAEPEVTPQIMVDQFGYRPAAEKWVMVANPEQGQNSAITYVPGTELQLCRASDGAVVSTVSLVPWNNGQLHTQSGDKVWQGNFSGFQTPGSYYFFDPVNNRRSYTFDIGDKVYDKILQFAVKTFYYQRCGCAITAEFGGSYTHDACHLQQKQALLYDGGAVAGTERDVSGGWHDAGDYRKYVTFTFTTLWDMLHAWEWYPGRFNDQLGIPESGNGIPDILDEIAYELKWMLRMQRDDGALYSGVFVTQGAGGIGDPAAENITYYYANISTSATATGATIFAIAARIFQTYDESFAGQLAEAAAKAWAFLASHPDHIPYNHNGFKNANANRTDAQERQLRVAAAAALFRLTGEAAYREYVDAHYNDPATAESGHQPINSGYFETGLSGIIQRGLVTYALSPGATPAVVSAIKSSLKQGILNQTYGQRNNDPYRAFMWDGHYSWASNSTKAQWGLLAVWGVKLQVDTAHESDFLAAAEEYLHYLHGRNPLSYVYLTRCGDAGAERSITRIYHSWFHDGTALEASPPPGYLAGGPNGNYKNDTLASNGTPVSPPDGEPRMKAYRDWNKSWPDCSWSVTEPAIYYQAKYIFLAAAFAADCPAAMEIRNPQNGSLIPSGDETPSETKGTDFGERVAGDVVTREFRIVNPSGQILELTGTNPVQFAAANPQNAFSLIQPEQRRLGAGASVLFSIRFQPPQPGSYTTKIEVLNSAEPSAYIFTITGTAVAPTSEEPQISVSGLGKTIAAGDSTPSTEDGTLWNDLPAGSAAVTHSFRIENTGTGILEFQSPAVILEPANGTPFAVAQPAVFQLAAGDDTGFDIIVTPPSAAGHYEAQVIVRSNDPTTPQYRFTVAAEVMAQSDGDGDDDGNGGDAGDGGNGGNTGNGGEPATANDDSGGCRFYVRQDGPGGLFAALLLALGGWAARTRCLRA